MHKGNLLTRDDTFFGVCEAIGEDFGFHANWLRLGLAVALFFSPTAVIGGYFAAGILVALSRWIAPNPAMPEADTGAGAARAEAAQPAPHADDAAKAAAPRDGAATAAVGEAETPVPLAA